MKEALAPPPKATQTFLSPVKLVPLVVAQDFQTVKLGESIFGTINAEAQTALAQKVKATQFAFKVHKFYNQIILLLKEKIEQQSKIIEMMRNLVKSYGDKISSYVEGCCRIEQHNMTDLMERSKLLEEATKAREHADG